MTVQFRDCTFPLGETNNYLIGGNRCNAFLLGELGSPDDFFLIGAEPPADSPYPLLTGNILDSEGNTLFRLVRNVIEFNPGDCSRVSGDRLGYEIHDSTGHPIFRVRTLFTELPGTSEQYFVTTLEANFFNKRGELVFAAHSGEGEQITSSTKSAFGFAGGEVRNPIGYSNDELKIGAAVLAFGGSIHRILTGEIRNQPITLDGHALVNARLYDCDVNIVKGDFILLDDACEMVLCRFHFYPPALYLKLLVEKLLTQNQPNPFGIWTPN